MRKLHIVVPKNGAGGGGGGGILVQFMHPGAELTVKFQGSERVRAGATTCCRSAFDTSMLCRYATVQRMREVAGEFVGAERSMVVTRWTECGGCMQIRVEEERA